MSFCSLRVFLAPAALIALAGCRQPTSSPLKAEPSAATAPAASPPAPAASPSAPAGSPSPSAAARPSPRYPAVPADVDPEKGAIAASICQAAMRHESGKVLVGCRTPPPFDELPPDGAFP